MRNLEVAMSRLSLRKILLPTIMLLGLTWSAAAFELSVDPSELLYNDPSHSDLRIQTGGNVPNQRIEVYNSDSAEDLMQYTVDVLDVIYNPDVPTPGVPWVTGVAPASGASTGSSNTHYISFDATGLAPGIYTAIIQFRVGGVIQENTCTVKIAVTDVEPGVNIDESYGFGPYNWPWFFATPPSGGFIGYNPPYVPIGTAPTQEAEMYPTLEYWMSFRGDGSSADGTDYLVDLLGNPVPEAKTQFFQITNGTPNTVFVAIEELSYPDNPATWPWRAAQYDHVYAEGAPNDRFPLDPYIPDDFYDSEGNLISGCTAARWIEIAPDSAVRCGVVFDGGAWHSDFGGNWLPTTGTYLSRFKFNNLYINRENPESPVGEPVPMPNCDFNDETGEYYCQVVMRCGPKARVQPWAGSPYYYDWAMSPDDVDRRYQITAVDTVARTFTIAGDQTGEFAIGDTANVGNDNNDPSNNGAGYDITDVVFDGLNTVITVSDSINSPLAAGYIMNAAISAYVSIPPTITTGSWGLTLDGSDYAPGGPSMSFKVDKRVTDNDGFGAMGSFVVMNDSRNAQDYGQWFSAIRGGLDVPGGVMINQLDYTLSTVATAGDLSGSWISSDIYYTTTGDVIDPGAIRHVLDNPKDYDAVAVNINSSGLDVGNYEAYVQVVPSDFFGGENHRAANFRPEMDPYEYPDLLWQGCTVPVSVRVEGPSIATEYVALSQTIDQGGEADDMSMKIWNKYGWSTLHYSVDCTGAMTPDGTRWLTWELDPLADDGSVADQYVKRISDAETMLFHFNASGLKTGTYTARFELTDENARPFPVVTFDITLEVLGPIISTSVTELNPKCQIGEPAQNDTFFYVWNADIDGMPAGHIGSTMDYTVTSTTDNGIDWISCKPVTGDSTGPGDRDLIEVTYNTMGLVGQGTSGEFTGKIIITSDSVGDSKEIDVKLTLINPVIAVDTNGLLPVADYGISPDAQAFQIWNANDDGTILRYSMAADASWMSVASSDAGQTSVGPNDRDTITVTYSTASLAPGIHTGTITITDDNASNSPQVIDVTLEVKGPVISVNIPDKNSNPPAPADNPQKVRFPFCQPGEDAEPGYFYVWNSGFGIMDYTITDNVDWLECEPASGTSTTDPITRIADRDQIFVVYDTDGLDAGTYSAKITISNPVATNNPVELDIVLVVENPLIAVNKTNLVASYDPVNGTLTGDQAFSTWNDGSGSLRYTMSSDALWLNYSITDVPAGYGETSPAPQITYNVGIGDVYAITADAASSYTFVKWTGSGGIAIHDTAAPATTITITGDCRLASHFTELDPVLRTGQMIMQVSGSGGGAVEPLKGAHTVYLDVPQDIFATAEEGYSFVSWLVEGDADIGSTLDAATEITLTGDAIVTAQFSDGVNAVMTMDMWSEQAGALDPAYGSKNSVPIGIAQNITATPIGPATFVNWTAEPAANAVFGDPNAAATTVTLSGDAIIVGHFESGGDVALLASQYPYFGVSTGEWDRVDLSYKAEDLPVGKHEAVLSVVGENSVYEFADNAPRKVYVTLTVGPSISVDPELLNPKCEEGFNADTQTFKLGNGGTGELFYSIVSDQPWLSCSTPDDLAEPVEGAVVADVYRTVTVTYDTAALLAIDGPHTATITITDTVNGLTLELPVELTIDNGSVLAIDPTELNPACGQGEQPVTENSFQVWNSATGTMRWSVEFDATALDINDDEISWISAVAPAAGTSTGSDDKTTVNITYNTATLPVSETPYEGTITVKSDTAGNAPIVIPVKLSVQGPTLAYSPEAIDESCDLNEVKVVNLVVWNNGGGRMDYDSSSETDDGAAWLALGGETSGSSTGPADTHTITVTLDATGLAEGVYTGDITLEDQDGEKGVIPVTMTVSGPEIATDKTAISLQTDIGGTDADTFDVWNSGGGTLDFTLTDDAAWLTVAPTSGSSTDVDDKVTITATADAAGLEPDTYEADITITNTDTAETYGVHVEFEVGLPRIATSVDEVTGTCEIDSAPFNETFQVWNSGSQVLDYTIATSTVDGGAWLAVAPTSGSSTGTTDRDTITVTFDPTGLDVGDYTGAITITAADAANSPLALPVTLSVTQSVPTEDLLVQLVGDSGGLSIQDGMVSFWPDMSGNENGAGQQKKNKMPYFASDAVNGKDAVGFDGKRFLAIDYLKGLPEGDGRTISVMFETSDDIQTKQVILEQGDKDAGFNFYIENRELYCVAWNDTLASGVNIWGPVSISTEVLANFAYYFIVVFDPDNALFSVYLNGYGDDYLVGQSRSVSEMYQPEGDRVGVGGVVGKTVFADGKSSGAKGFFGDIAEVIYYGKALGEDDLELVANHMTSKYSVVQPSFPVEGLALWIEGNRLAMEFKDGAFVKKWKDNANMSKKGIYLKAGGKKMPLFETGVVGDEDAVIFDGVDDNMKCRNSTEINSSKTPYTQKTIFAVFKADSLASRQVIWTQGNKNSGLNIYVEGGSAYMNAWNVKDKKGAAAWGVKTVSGTVTAVANGVYCAQFVFNADSATLSGYVNGAQLGTTATGVGSMFKHSSAILGANAKGTMIGGAWVKGGGVLDGAILEMLFYNSALTAEQTGDIEDYFAAKYGIVFE